ncbi:class I SAM-dependent methyltransferase [Methanolobus halotolerans]|uniref:Methyltransferase type 11 n=1 Tax=Methanolobus halotolerans TaxID=2052935 RepID=A0A4E0PXN5_9EURY|nr:class I SAM-dependent methyltransferase [Methanolobus halotolerans]TGC09483.1 methyltransferase type 11 [Methanolobus halotolerans]
MSIISKYNRFSHVYDLMEIPIEYSWYAKWRKGILSGLSGRVLEVGVGTGKNLPYYPDDCEVIGIDISDKMLERAKSKSENKGNISLFIMDAENLAFRNDTFDHIITTFVLCSIPDPVAALKEMRRVCKPDGTVINVEHMKSSNRIISLAEDIFDPVTSGLTGVHINRKTVENVKKAGLNITEEKNLALKDVFRLIVSEP